MGTPCSRPSGSADALELSGVETDSPNWTVFTIRDGKIASGHEYATREQALEAAGLSE